MKYIKVQLKLLAIVIVYCAIAYLNAQYLIISNNHKVNVLIYRGAQISVLMYVIYIIICSFRHLSNKNK